MKIEAKKLANAINKVLPLISNNSPRNYASVVHFDDGHMVATDGFSLKKIKLNAESFFDKPFSLPPNSLKQIKSLCTGNSGEVDLVLGSETLRVNTRSTSNEYRLSNLDYPKYKNILVESNTKKQINLTPKVLANLIKGFEKEESIRLSLSEDNNTLVLETKNDYSIMVSRND